MNHSFGILFNTRVIKQQYTLQIPNIYIYIYYYIYIYIIIYNLLKKKGINNIKFGNMGMKAKCEAYTVRASKMNQKKKKIIIITSMFQEQ